MKLPAAPVKISYTNPIAEWYNANTDKPQLVNQYDNYDKGMLISISNNQLQHNDIINDFKELYISFLVGLTGKKISKWDIRKINGDWYGDRIKLPTRDKLLDLLANKIPVMLCAVHNYKKDDIRSKGKEYCHSHFYVYNAHHYLPKYPVDLADRIDKIERHLTRYTNLRKRKQGIVRITEVGKGKYLYTDNVTPTTLYDYLESPMRYPHKDNVINYIANNRHLPEVQYPLSFFYLNKRL